MAFAATIYDNGCKQGIFRMSWIVAGRCFEAFCVIAEGAFVNLLLWEFYDESLAKEAHEIINTWDKAGLSLEQAEIAEELKGFEENQYPWEEFNDDLE